MVLRGVLTFACGATLGAACTAAQPSDLYADPAEVTVSAPAGGLQPDVQQVVIRAHSGNAFTLEGSFPAYRETPPRFWLEDLPPIPGGLLPLREATYRIRADSSCLPPGTYHAAYPVKEICCESEPPIDFAVTLEITAPVAGSYRMAGAGTQMGGGLITADLDGDGTLDLVGGDGLSTVRSLLARAGDFVVAGEVSVPGRISRLGAGDLDADGHADVVVSTGQVDGVPYPLQGEPLWLVRARADGTLEDPVALGIAGDFPLLADLDADGMTDLVFVTWTEVATEIGYARGLGGGALAAPVMLPLPSGGLADIFARDTDHDGDLDLVASYLSANGGDGVMVATFDATGTTLAWVGGFASDVIVGGPLTIGDVDGDGRWEGVFNKRGTGMRVNDAVAIVLAGYEPGLGMRTIAEHPLDEPLYDSPFASAAAIGDIDGDGRSDLAVAFWDRPARYWSFGTTEPPREFPLGSRPRDLAFLPGGDIAAANGCLALWHAP